ncbi:hypothetical protein RO3G_08781 [Lichtheimia corymbifera JMRC:FSU:9682]|uniref:Rap-GAP domain-containing protein n=1 Tax=Lichtheimia corymbifera JMRC:FSU:9682 TaxID=1263082 RepID=A0A068RRR4_9FUNG|nr:hypothetical protein RO3G_08781 [Lichtheimia corymbifera JMRC:FSU:9682]
MVLPKLLIVVNTDFVSVEDLRLAAIKVVSTVMCLPNHFDKVELKPEWDRDLQCASDSASILGEQEQIVTQLIRVLYADQPHDDVERPFTCLKFYILEVLLMSLRTETSSYNMRYLLHLINVYVVEDVPFCPGLVGTVVKLIEEKILTMQMPADVTLVAFDVLIDFVDLYDYVKRDSKNVARELVLALSRYVDTLINAGKLSHSYPLIVQAYDCMMKWILTSQWIIDDRDCYKAVISTLSRGITIFDRDTDQPPETPQEKKKRRDPMPSKPLFQLPPRPSVKMSTSSGNNSGGGNTSQSSSRSNSNAVRKEQVAVRMAAEYCMSQFVNQLGRASPLNGSVNQKAEDLQQLRIRRSQRRSDQGDVLPWESRDAIRYFLLDKRMILAVFDIESQQDEKDVPAVKFIIRDTTGRHIWSIDAQYKDEQKQTHPSSPPQQQSPKMTHERNIVGSKSLTDSLQVSEAPTADAANSDAIPSIDDLVSVDPASWSQWEFVKSMAECEQEEENETLDRIHKRPLDRFMISPTAANVNTESARGFRLLLSELGLLLPKNRSRITPLRITDSLITEIETLDMLNDRDCISITAYYASSGNTTWEDLVETPPPLSPQFLQFLNCLGWPIQVESHTGFKGKLDSSICKTIPYYADRNVEFVVNVPYFLHTPPNDDNTWGSASNITKIHRMVSADDHVCVIWIEDLDNYTALAKRIKASNSSNAKSMVYIFINPLRNSANSLYWIRVHIPLIGNNATSVVSSQRLNDNALIFGPLADGMIVSRHALGSMVRNTAISAHQACRVVTDTYTRPYVVRKQFIEEMLHRHRSKMQLSEFYAEMFSGKDT